MHINARLKMIGSYSLVHRTDTDENEPTRQHGLLCGKTKEKSFKERANQGV